MNGRDSQAVDRAQHDVEIAPELGPLELADKPDGPAAAAMVAAGIGILVLGVLTTLAVVSETMNDFLAAIGVGLLVVMATWIMAARAAALLWSSSSGYVAALGLAGIAGTIATLVATRRLSRIVEPERA